MTDELEPLSTNETELLHAYRALNPAAQYYFLELVRAVVEGRPRRAAWLLRDFHAAAGRPAPSRKLIARFCAAARRQAA